MTSFCIQRLEYSVRRQVLAFPQLVEPVRQRLHTFFRCFIWLNCFITSEKISAGSWLRPSRRRMYRPVPARRMWGALLRISQSIIRWIDTSSKVVKATQRPYHLSMPPAQAEVSGTQILPCG